MKKIKIESFNRGREVILKVTHPNGQWSELTMSPDLADEVSASLKTVAKVARRN